MSQGATERRTRPAKTTKEAAPSVTRVLVLRPARRWRHCCSKPMQAPQTRATTRCSAVCARAMSGMVIPSVANTPTVHDFSRAQQAAVLSGATRFKTSDGSLRIVEVEHLGVLVVGEDFAEPRPRNDGAQGLLGLRLAHAVFQFVLEPQSRRAMRRTLLENALDMRGQRHVAQ